MARMTAAQVLEHQRHHGFIEAEKVLTLPLLEAGSMAYLPDFKVTLKSGAIEYREVKGWMDERSIEKIRLMGEVHPTVKLRLIRGDWFSRNARRLQRIIQDWEPQ